MNEFAAVEVIEEIRDMVLEHLESEVDDSEDRAIIAEDLLQDILDKITTLYRDG
jgi:hypothetical protein